MQVSMPQATDGVVTFALDEENGQFHFLQNSVNSALCRTQKDRGDGNSNSDVRNPMSVTTYTYLTYEQFYW